MPTLSGVFSSLEMEPWHGWRTACCVGVLFWGAWEEASYFPLVARRHFATSWDSMFLLYTYLISGDEAASFSATGWGGCVAGKVSANDSWNCLQPESNHLYRELTIFHFIVWKIFTLIISHDTLRKLTKSDQAGKHYFPIRLLMYVE